MPEMIKDYEQLLIEWAHTYNGYKRLGGGPDKLIDLLAPLRLEFERQGTIPEWAGVDLLRGWAFYLVRAHRHGGGYDPLTVEYPEIIAIADAIDRHPADRSRPAARANRDLARRLGVCGCISNCTDQFRIIPRTRPSSETL